MGKRWIDLLEKDPLPCLLSWQDAALSYFARLDLLEEKIGPVEMLWETPGAVRLVEKQQPTGAWRYPGKSYDPRTGANYDLLETYRSLRLLVEIYGLHRGHLAMQKAAGYVFSCQTEEGDIRGILGNQYMPYYCGAILELLIKAGFAGDERLEKGLKWLLSVRQADGGWLVPAQAVPAKQKTDEFWPGKPSRADPHKPSSHLATGMALRAFAAHPEYCRHPQVTAAGEFLKTRLFQADRYNDRKQPSYWLKFQYPFWWTSLLTALDTLSWLGFSCADEHIARGLDWFLSNQQAGGLWQTGYGSGGRAEENRRWVGLAVCRILKRFYEREGAAA